MSSLDDLIKNVNKSLKEEVITYGLSSFSYQRIPFTSPRMNYCTYGGLPVGKLIEFYGENGGGKTTTALDAIANYQKLEELKAEADPNYTPRRVLYCDCENTLDYEWATKLGVNISPDAFILYRPTSQGAESIFEFICNAVNTGEIGFWVLDSIGVLVSQQEWDKTIEEKTYGGISKPLTLFSKKVEGLMQRHACTGIGINQIREDLNSMYGGKTTPGGIGWRHNCSVRMEFRKGKYLDEKGNELSKSAETPCGNVILMSMTKNKTCPPNRRTGEYSINYDIGVDYVRDLIDVAMKYGVIDKKGAWFTILDPDSGEVIRDKIQGQATLISLLEDESELLDSISNVVNSKLGLNNVQ